MTFKGKYFDFKDCHVSELKPVKTLSFLICAGQSQRGFEFSVREADGCFIGGRNEAEEEETAQGGAPCRWRPNLASRSAPIA